MIHINEIKLEGEDAWTKQFNSCSDSYAKAMDESLSPEERKAAQEEYTQKRICLEMGIY